MKLKEIYSQKNKEHNGIFGWVKPVISFEVFPPKNGEDELVDELKKLKKYNPAFVSLTCNAGGNDNKSLELIKSIKEETEIDVMPHFTCICNTKEQVIEHLNDIKNEDVKNILALRGDKPESVCQSEFCYANELVHFIKEHTNLSVGVAGYPEGHIECRDIFTDIENLKRKVDAGAEVIFTQLFFDNDKFFSYIQLVRDAGINLPIVPGIMPIISEKQVAKMTGLANICVPDSLCKKIDKYKDNSDDMRKLGIDFASYQCQQLIDAEVSGLHFYTLNKAHSTAQILENII